MNHFSLFTGVGGIDKAAEDAGFETIGQCEIAEYPYRVLEKHWPNVPKWRDARDVTAESIRQRTGIYRINLLSAGYPFPPFSNAGKRRGAEDDRYLWPEVYRIIQEVEPDWFLGENVAGHVSLGLDEVLSDLESIGYETQAFVIPAAAVNAPHRRDRVFIVAHATSTGFPIWGQTKLTKSNAKSRTRMESEPQRCSEWSIESRMCRVLDGLSSWVDGLRWPAPYGREQYDWEPPRVAVNIKNRIHRIQGLGNAVSPPQIFPILKAIAEIQRMVNESE